MLRLIVENPTNRLHLMFATLYLLTSLFTPIYRIGRAITLHKCLIGVSTEDGYIISPSTESYLLLIHIDVVRNLQP